MRLLRERSDLSTPAPADCSQLASRAATRSSLNRALDLLTRLELSVLDALVATGHTTEAELRHILDAEASAVESAVRRLLDLALVWENDLGLRPLTGVPDALGSLAGLHPVSGRTPEQAAAVLAELSPPARAMLEHVEAGSGEADAGSARHQIAPDEATTPAEELLARGLLVPGRPGLVRVPGEVQIALRGGHTTRHRIDVPPEVATSPRAADMVDRAAAGAAFDVVRRVELLVDHWGTAPPVALRTGALAVRDLKAAVEIVQLDERATDAHRRGRGGVRTARHLARLATATRPGPPPRPSTAGARSRRPSAGADSRRPGSPPSACPPWSAPATRRASPATRWTPS